MTVASSHDDAARERPLIGPVIAGHSRRKDVAPATELVLPPLFVRSVSNASDVRPATETEDIGARPATTGAGSVDGQAAASPEQIDAPSTWGDFGAARTVEGGGNADLRTDEPGDRTSAAEEQPGAEVTSPPVTADAPDAWDGWTSMPSWLRALEREAEGPSASQSGAAATAPPPLDPWEAGDQAAGTTSANAADVIGEDPLHHRPEGLPDRPDEVGLVTPADRAGGSGEPVPEEAPAADIAGPGASEFGGADRSESLPEEQGGIAAGGRELEPAQEPRYPEELSTAADVPPRSIARVGTTSVEQIASRLERIAATLRQSGPEAFAHRASDPLGAIISAYLLGMEDGSGGSNEAP